MAARLRPGDVNRNWNATGGATGGHPDEALRLLKIHTESSVSETRANG